MRVLDSLPMVYWVDADKNNGLYRVKWYNPRLVRKGESPGFIISDTVTGFHMRDETSNRGLPREEYLVVRSCCGGSHHVNLRDLGKTAFFSKSEAEECMKKGRPK